MNYKTRTTLLGVLASLTLVLIVAIFIKDFYSDATAHTAFSNLELFEEYITGRGSWFIIIFIAVFIGANKLVFEPLYNAFSYDVVEQDGLKVVYGSVRLLEVNSLKRTLGFDGKEVISSEILAQRLHATLVIGPKDVVQTKEMQ